MSFIIGALKIIFVLGFLILIHEGGHFLVAKACKVKVKEFSIGFGPKIFKKQGKETQYSLRLIPLGGFVDMVGEAERSDEVGSFSSSPVWKRILIVIAGATVNIVFGCMVYFSLIAINFDESSLIVNEILPEYSNNISQLEINDEILKINDKKIDWKVDYDQIIKNLSDEKISLEVKRNNEIKNIDVKATEVESYYSGIYLDIQDFENITVKYVYPESPAEKAGVQADDKIKSINGIVANNTDELSKCLDTAELNLQVERKGENVNIDVKPSLQKSFVLGVKFKPAESSLKNRIYYGFLETKYYIEQLGDSLVSMFKGNVSKEQMMGPIGISSVIVKSETLAQYIYFLSVISISLGVTNLLPIPALDGGKLLLLIIEWIRRKPLNEKVEIWIQMIGFLFIISLSLMISFNDVLRIF